MGEGRASPGLELQITVNGEPATTRAASLAELIEQAGYAGARVATALNGNFVPARARPTTLLHAGDHVEIVAPRQGG
jgi:sulfur carrier protein